MSKWSILCVFDVLKGVVPKKVKIGELFLRKLLLDFKIHFISFM